jgi:hypothetical protein
VLLQMLADADAQLLEIVLTNGLPPGFACGLDGRQKQRYQDADNDNDHQQFHERKTGNRRFFTWTNARLKSNKTRPDDAIPSR